MKTKLDHIAVSNNTELNTGDGWLSLLLQCFLVFGAALLSRIALLDHPPIYDELYQMLPAISWQREGTFNVLDGTYDRGSLFTTLIAYCFSMMSEYSVTAARFVPSAVPGALLIMIMFVWTFKFCGQVPALIVGAFMILWPNGIEVSQYVRFYALHGVIFIAAVLLIYLALVPERLSLAVRALSFLGALILLFFAIKLQVLTVLTLAGVGLWIALFFLPKWLKAEPRLWWLVAAAVLAVIAVLGSGVLNETIIWAWTTYNWEPWPPQDDTTFYHRHFRDVYPTFWPLFPIAAIIALRANFWPATFSIAIFGTAFLLQSFGGLKNIRYLYSAMPFFFVIWGIAIAAVWPKIRSAMMTSASHVLPSEWSEDIRRKLALGALTVAMAFVVAANAAVPRSIKLIAGKDENRLLGKTRWHWAEATDMIQPWLEKGALIVTSEEMRAVQNIGDFDLAFSKPRFSELLYVFGPDTQPFHEDFRSGRPVIGETKDMQSIISCNTVGILVMDANGLRAENTQDLIMFAHDQRMVVSVDARAGMSLVGWEHSAQTKISQNCDEVYDFGADRAAERILDGRSQPQDIVSAAAVK